MPVLPMVEPLQRDVLAEDGESQLDQSLSSRESSPRGVHENDLFLALDLSTLGFAADSVLVFVLAFALVLDPTVETAEGLVAFLVLPSGVSDELWGGSNTVLTRGRNGR